MKNKKGSRTVNIITSIFNIRDWVDFNRLKSFTGYLANLFKNLFIPQKKIAGESFEDALARLNIGEKDLKNRESALYRLSLVMTGAALFILAYAIYHLVYGNFKATLVSLVVMLIALALAFRYHFWYFQIKERKLGCTIKEWFKHGLMGDK